MSIDGAMLSGHNKSFGAPCVSELEIGPTVSKGSGRLRKIIDIRSLNQIPSCLLMIRLQREGGRPVLDLLDLPGSAGSRQTRSTL